MTRPHPLARWTFLWAATASPGDLRPDRRPRPAPGRRAKGQGVEAAAPSPVGRLFPIEQPITSEVVDRFKVAAKALVQQAAKDGQAADPLPRLPARSARRAGARRRPRPLPHPRADRRADRRLRPRASGRLRGDGGPGLRRDRHGPRGLARPDHPRGRGGRFDRSREFLRRLARDTGRDPGLLLGMLDREADLRAVRTADRQLHFVLARRPAGVREGAGRRRRPAGLGGRPPGRPDRRARPGDRRLQAHGRRPRRPRRRLRHLGHRRPDPRPGRRPRLDPDRGAGRHARTDTTSSGGSPRRARRRRTSSSSRSTAPAASTPTAETVADLISDLKDIKTVAYVVNATGRLGPDPPGLQGDRLPQGRPDGRRPRDPAGPARGRGAGPGPRAAPGDRGQGRVAGQGQRPPAGRRPRDGRPRQRGRRGQGQPDRRRLRSSSATRSSPSRAGTPSRGPSSRPATR